MEAKPNSQKPGAWKQTAQKSLQVGSASRAKLLGWTRTKMIPWCCDHLFSVAVLLTVPLGIAAFYFGTKTSESFQPPEYLQTESESDSDSGFGDESYRERNWRAAEVASATPEFAPKPVPQVLDFPGEPEGPGFAAPRPLPISVDSPEILESLENASHGSWNSPVPANYRTNADSSNCVWLTGTIDDSNEGSPRVQNASRVHELTHPNQN